MPTDPKHSRQEAAAEEKVLQADDPRPQRVAQLPSDSIRGRRAVKNDEDQTPTSMEEADRVMQAEYGLQGSTHKSAFLYVERGPGAGQLLEVKQGTAVVGRASISDLRLQHPSISRRHTQLKRVGEQFFLKDLGSQNGTYVNKQRIGSEVEVKPGDSIAVGNALLRLRGPLTSQEKIARPASRPKEASKGRTHTIPAARIRTPPVDKALRIAVVAGAAGFTLAAVLAFALVKAMSNDRARSSPSVVVAKPVEKTEKERLIDEAIKRKMAEPPVQPQPVEPAAEEEVVIPDEQVRVTEEVTTPVVSAAPTIAKVAPPTKKPAPSGPAEKVREGSAAAAPASSPAQSKRTQILAAYEKGDAEASLEAAKKAGDKELSDKLSRFIAAYDAANDAMVSHNGAAAIANFQKAMQLDEGLSTGWGKYAGEIRRQLSSLYVLVGLQFVSNQDSEKAKVAFQAALKHEPGNERAKQQLAKLGSAPKSADDALADEVAGASPPAKKVEGADKPSKPKPAGQGKAQGSIDEAFGD